MASFVQVPYKCVELFLSLRILIDFPINILLHVGVTIDGVCVSNQIY
jgi:hypothetical protein